MPKKKKSEKETAVYKTLASAERAETDRQTNVAVPSEENVEKMRRWSEENKL